MTSTGDDLDPDLASDSGSQQLVSPSGTKVGQFEYYNVLKAHCVNRSSWYSANLAFELFYRGFCNVSFSVSRVAYKLSADAVGVGSVESTVQPRSRDRVEHAAGKSFSGVIDRSA
jgi:hypothetical protein